MKKFQFSPLWRCNEDCLFCVKGTAPAGADKEFPVAKAVKLLKAKRRAGFSALAIDGGEPTLYSGLRRLVGAALRSGYKEVSLLTNGALLADRKNLRALLDVHPKARERLLFCVSLHSHKPEVSDFLTGSAGNFPKTVRAIKNMLAEGCRPSLYHAMTRLNARALPAFAKFAAGQFPGLHTVTFSYLYPPPHKMGNMRIYPRLSEIPPRLSAAAGILKAAGVRVELSSCGIIPWCLMKGTESLFLSRSLQENSGTLTCDSSKEEPMPFLKAIYDGERKHKLPACAKCALGMICGGVWDFYAELYGTSEISPCANARFKALPASGGRAVIRAPQTSPEELCLRVFDARLKGYVKIDLKTARPLPGKDASRVRRFARGIGCGELRLGA